MIVFDLFGVGNRTLDDARLAVERALGVELQARESSFIGEYFFLQRGIEQLMLRENVDPEDHEPAEREFAEYPVLLYVSEPLDPEGTRSALEGAGFTLLRHEEHA